MFVYCLSHQVAKTTYTSDCSLTETVCCHSVHWSFILKFFSEEDVFQSYTFNLSNYSTAILYSMPGIASHRPVCVQYWNAHWIIIFPGLHDQNHWGLCWNCPWLTDWGKNTVMLSRADQVNIETPVLCLEMNNTNCDSLPAINRVKISYICVDKI